MIRSLLLSFSSPGCLVAQRGLFPAATDSVRMVIVLITIAAWAVSTLPDKAEAQDATDPPEPNTPQIQPESNEASLALEAFKVPSDVSGNLFAAEPLFANPVAFYVDDQGRVFVCETFRQGIGVVDNRNYSDRWVDADLAAQTVEDRRQYHLEQLSAAEVERFMEEDDQIRLLIDSDQDGRADESHVFANRFNGLVDGTGAGILEYRGNVYYTCIPDLYVMRDEDGDYQADGRTSLHSGYGIRVAFRGHDLHGLVIGPDGRLYFSIGDRGANIELPGGNLSNIESGSVFRCELDGSNLEIFATGLRNPQELAFDNYGNLFTGDNNSDSGDQARWVYVVEDGDSGWRMAYQYLSDRGPFNREKIWEPLHEGQPSYIVPPIRNISDGPSGLDFYPGTGFGEMFQDHFLLADFRGTANVSGIRAIRNEADGAFFKIAEDSQPFWEILATDLQFGPDGALYVSDWVNGWEGEGKGRIYRFQHSTHKNDAIVKDVQKFLGSDVSEMSSPELAKRLSHVDRRVRQKSQLELATRGDFTSLVTAIHNGESVVEKLHGIWGLDHLGRMHPRFESDVILAWLDVVWSDEPEIRAHAVRLLGEFAHRATEAKDDVKNAIQTALKDENARVRYFAMVSARKAKVEGAVEHAVHELENNAGRDPVLRHGAVMLLAELSDASELVKLREHSSVHVRLGAVVALRRQGAAEVAEFLSDADAEVIAEAARAIHDVPITGGMERLATVLGKSDHPSVVRRALSANYRIGNAERLAKFAADAEQDDSLRKLAVSMLSDWDEPNGRDKIIGLWRPIEPRSNEPLTKALEPLMAEFLEADSDIRLDIGKLAGQLQIRSGAELLRSILKDDNLSASDRASALTSLVSLRSASEMDVQAALEDESVQVRAAALEALPAIMPETAQAKLAEAAENGEMLERQTAIRVLGEQSEPSAELLDLLISWGDGKLPKPLLLEAKMAAAAHAENPTVATQIVKVETATGGEPVDAYRYALEGGDVTRGRRIFWEKVSVSCVRCHQIRGNGGQVGPDLTQIGKDKSREYLLEAIVDPNKTIAKGFESAVILDADDQVHTGVIREETDESLTLIDAEGRITTFAKDDIEARNPAKSGMPADIIKNLSDYELRDLVEYLSSLDGRRQPRERRDPEVL